MPFRLRKTVFRAVSVVIAGALAYVAGVRHKISLIERSLESHPRIETPATNPPSDADVAASTLTILNGTKKVQSNNGPVELDHTERAMFIASLIVTSRDQGLAQLAILAPSADTQSDFSRIFGVWASQGSEEALDAAAAAYGLPAGKNRDAALNSVIDTWAGMDSKAVLDWAASLAATDSGPLMSALSDVAGKQGEPVLAANYLDQLMDATSRSKVIGTIAAAMAKTDPAGTLNWLDKTATGDTYDSSVINLINNLSNQDPVQAAALMDKVTEPGVRDQAITSLVSSWADVDPSAALAWLQTLPDSDSAVRDALMPRFAQTLNRGQ